MIQAACPRCRTSLDGGPVVYHCGQCRRDVWAADLDVDHHAQPTTTRR